MPSIIQPKSSFVKTSAGAQVLDEKSAKLGAQLESELASKLITIYEKINVVFFGTPEFAVLILKELIKSDFKPNAVITSPDKPIGRNQEITPPPVKILTQQYEIPVFQPAGKEELVKTVTGLKPDLIIVTAFGTILPNEILKLPKYGSINVHPSLLPKHRGPSPIQFSILNGDQTTGVSIILMNEKIDEGPILAQEEINIEKEETSQTLQNKLSELGGRLLVKTLNYWIILKEMPKRAQYLIYPQPQNNSTATYTKILTKNDGKIFWNKTAQELERQIRAFFPWPGSFTYFKSSAKQLSLKIIKAFLLNLQTEKQLGEVFLTPDNQLAVQTSKDCLILSELQLEGGKSMSAGEFINGHKEIIGTILV